jgi:hypothetical protein
MFTRADTGYTQAHGYRTERNTGSLDGRGATEALPGGVHAPSALKFLLLVAALAAVFTAGTAPRASAAWHYYYSGTLTHDNHNFGRCFYSIGSDCTGFMIWQLWNEAVMADMDDGDSLLAFDNNQSIRGIFMWAPGFRWVVTPGQVEWQTHQNLRASVTLWTNTWVNFSYARTCVENSGTCSTVRPAD